MAEGVEPPLRRRRPAKGSYPDTAEWVEEDLGERPVSDKKLRRVRRQLGVAGDQAPSGAPLIDSAAVLGDDD